MSSRSAPSTSQHLRPRGELTDREAALDASAEGLTGAKDIRCMIPGCPDLASDQDALPAVSLGSRDARHAFAGELRLGGALWASFNCAARLLWIAWRFLRQVSGDDAYERYREHMAHAHPGQLTMSRSQYFRFCQEQKWNRVTRCC